MNFLSKIPGPFLVFLGACALSFGGLIVKSFEGSTLWQILFWRSLFFIGVITIFLIFTYKGKIFSALYKSGIPGLIGGIILSIGFASYVFAMYETTVANANFIIQTQALFLAIFGYVFLKEKISKITLTCIITAVVGIILMLGSSLTPRSNDWKPSCIYHADIICNLNFNCQKISKSRHDTFTISCWNFCNTNRFVYVTEYFGFNK